MCYFLNRHSLYHITPRMSTSAQHKLKNNRESWKAKAVERGDTVHYLKKENNRLKSQHKCDKHQLVEIKARLEAERKNNVPLVVNNKAALFFLIEQQFFCNFSLASSFTG